LWSTDGTNSHYLAVNPRRGAAAHPPFDCRSLEVVPCQLTSAGVPAQFANEFTRTGDASSFIVAVLMPAR